MFYYAGQTVSMHDPETGKVIQAQIFITILGASNYTFVKATLFQSLPHWIKFHIHAFEFFGGAPHILVPGIWGHLTF
jgi:transposase